MDAIETIQQGLIEREYATYVSLFVIITVIIAVLSFIIVSQNKKINELQRPRYGFLGKPLAVFLAIGLLVGSYGVIFYANRNSTNVGNVSADREISGDINYVDLGSGKYLFNVVPNVNTQPWGKDPENQFNVYWTFSGKNVESQVELDISQNKPGGVNVQLERDVYKVKIVIFLQETKFEKTEEIDLTQ